MAHNEVLIDALARRIQARQLSIKQVPEPLQKAVQAKLDESEAEGIDNKVLEGR